MDEVVESNRPGNKSSRCGWQRGCRGLQQGLISQELWAEDKDAIDFSGRSILQRMSSGYLLVNYMVLFYNKYFHTGIIVIAINQIASYFHHGVHLILGSPYFMAYYYGATNQILITASHGCYGRSMSGSCWPFCWWFGVRFRNGFFPKRFEHGVSLKEPHEQWPGSPWEYFAALFGDEKLSCFMDCVTKQSGFHGMSYQGVVAIARHGYGSNTGCFRTRTLIDG